jgi:signal transduction histidine kinase
MILVTVVYLTVVIAAAVYPLVSPLRQYDPIPVSGQVVRAISGLVWLVTLLVEMRRQPSGRLWKLIFLLAVADRIWTLRFVPDSLVWSLATTFQLVSIPVFFHLLVAFPTGYLRDRFDRAVVVFAYVYVVGLSAVDHLLWESAIGCNPACIENIFVVWPNWDAHEWLRSSSTLLFNVLFVPILIVALRRHWQAATPAARRTLLPVIVATPLLMAINALQGVGSALDLEPINAAFETPSGDIINRIAPLIMPVALLIGILRARLGRVRIAGLVAELGRGVPLGGLRDVLAQTMGDPSLELAFAAPSGTGFVDASGRVVDVPAPGSARTVTRLERDGELLGVLVHDPAIDDEDPGFVEAVGNAARLALENERLAAEVRAQLEEVRASRVRIVEAADSERRRVERDLHDGAQQRLVALAMRMQVAKETTPGAAALLDEATTELQTAIGEVRGLARGIHPTILTEAGLRAAVDALAERTPVPVLVEIDDRRYDPQLEATAYFVVAEALTNVARYAGATEVRVSAVEDDGRLVVTVVDGGRGGADPIAGSGLRGLADRLAALDGRLTISSPKGGGTTVTAELPLDSATGSRTDDPPVRAAPSLAMVHAVPEWRETPRRRTRVRLSDPAVLIAVGAAALAVVAVVAALPGLERPPDSGRDESFVRPFVYLLPADSDIALEPHSDRLHVLGGRLGGISIWAVGDVLVDHCSWDPTTPVTSRQPGMAGLLAYIRSVPRLHVEEVGPRTIDGRPAFRVDLTVEENDSGCLEPDEGSILLWRDKSANGHGGLIQVYDDNRVPVTILEVDGETIAIEIWSGDELDAWEPMAEKIVESFRFLYRAPAGSPSESPSPSTLTP